MRVDPFCMPPSAEADRTSPLRGADRVVEWLLAQGVRLAFGVSGGGVSHLWHALAHAPGLRVIHTAHEGGAAFAAAEASLETGAPVAVFTTTGPGLTNALTGLAAARQEGARVVVISGVTPLARRRRGATQETHEDAPLAGLYSSGPLFDEASVVAHASMLGPALQRAAEVLARPGGAVVHIGLTTDVQADVSPSAATVGPVRVAGSRVEPTVLDALAGLAGRRVRVVVGFGARGAASQVRTLLERTGWTAVSTPRGKGILPERHPRCAGVLGFGGHARAEAAFDERPEVVIALGTHLGEASSGWIEGLAPTRLLVVVGDDGELMAGPFAAAPLLAVHAPVATFLEDLLGRIPPREAPPLRAGPPTPLEPRAHGPVRASFLVDAVQRVVVEESDALVLAESGNAFAWAIHRLRLDAPRLRVSVGFGSMGHMTSGVIGVAAVGRRAVALVGDGAMLMGNELATAAREGLPATWVVLNDSQYGMCRQGLAAHGLGGTPTDLVPVDFAGLAAAVGVRAERVTTEAELAAALRRSVQGPGPCLVDVRIDREEPAPIGRRLRALTWHASGGEDAPAEPAEAR